MSGLLALSVAVKMNDSIRCLDISIPINDPDMANLSQDILQSCVRNTEAAQEKSGKTKNLFGPIQRSVLAKKLQEAEVQQSTAAVVAAAESPEGIARARVWNQTPQETLIVSQETLRNFNKCFSDHESEPGNQERLAPLQSYVNDRHLQVKALKDRLMELIGEGLIENESELNLALSLNDQLASLDERVEAFIKVVGEKEALARQQVENADFTASGTPSASSQPKQGNRNRARSLSINDEEMSNPQFQIMGSDDSDAETENEIVVDRVAASELVTHEREDVIDGAAGTDASASSSKPKLAISTDVDHHEEEATPKPITKTVPNSEEVKSPTTDLSRSQLFEEGDIFRKGIALLNDERIEGEEDGEALRKEILETELPHPSPKSPASPKPDALSSAEPAST